jgi:hypothetical protein
MPGLKFPCPHCKQSLEAPEEMLGETISCPSCQGSIEIPDPRRQRPAPHPPQSTKAALAHPQEQQPMHAASTADDPHIANALAHLSSLLVPNETMVAYAVQRRLFALTHRRALVFATSGRFIGMERGSFGGFTPQDVRWQDLKDARIRVGIFGAEIIIEALSSPDLAVSGSSRTIRFGGLRKDEAQAVYRICQTQEQSWREKRRLRELEELRAKSGGIQLGTPAAGAFPQQTQPGSPDAATRLQQAKEMLDKGLISDSEFETIKARVIGSI